MQTEINLSQLSNQDLANLIQTTRSPEHIAFIQRVYEPCLTKKIELRRALYAVARQNAQHRHALSLGGELPPVASLGLPSLTVPGLIDVLKRTHDSRAVDQIQELTEYRLKRLPELRRALFEIAREGVAYREE